MRGLIALLLTITGLLLLSAALHLGGAGVNEVVDASKDTLDAAPSRPGAPAPAPPTPTRASRSRHTEPPSRLDLLDWHGLAQCESSNNPRAVSGSGRYRGLYQFDLPTWHGVGGHGDPAGASRAEQTLRARLLYKLRGRAPWPVCGARL